AVLVSRDGTEQLARAVVDAHRDAGQRVAGATLEDEAADSGVTLEDVLAASGGAATRAVAESVGPLVRDGRAAHGVVVVLRVAGLALQPIVQVCPDESQAGRVEDEVH